VDEEKFAAEEEAEAEADAEAGDGERQRLGEDHGEGNGDGVHSKGKDGKGKRGLRTIDPRVYEWHKESVVAAWIAGLPDPSNDEGFTIDSRERPEIPPVLQQALGAAAERERADLGARIELLSSEKQQAVQAFDTYRERAKVSLVKSAAEQKAAESKLAQATLDLQAERAGRAKAEAVAAEKEALDSALAAATAELAVAATTRQRLEAALIRAEAGREEASGIAAALTESLAQERALHAQSKVGRPLFSSFAPSLHFFAFLLFTTLMLTPPIPILLHYFHPPSPFTGHAGFGCERRESSEA
jgi:hypothetical protein